MKTLPYLIVCHALWGTIFKRSANYAGCWKNDATARREYFTSCAHRTICGYLLHVQDVDYVRKNISIKATRGNCYIENWNWERKNFCILNTALSYAKLKLKRRQCVIDIQLLNSQHSPILWNISRRSRDFWVLIAESRRSFRHVGRHSQKMAKNAIITHYMKCSKHHCSD